MRLFLGVMYFNHGWFHLSIQLQAKVIMARLKALSEVSKFQFSTRSFTSLFSTVFREI